MSKLLGVILVVSGLTTGQAQLRLGIKGGMNLAGFSSISSDKSNAGLLVGGMLGVYTTVPLSSSVFVQPAFAFTQKGGKVAFLNGTTTTRLNALEISGIIGKSFQWFSIGGGGTFNIPAQVTSQRDGITNDVRAEANRFLVGVLVQLSFNLPQTRFSLQTSYEAGLTRIFDNNANVNLKTNVVQLTIGYKLL